MMQPKLDTYIDKSDWGPGPWQQEPDRVEWRDEATGLPCLIVRGGGGALCGYVSVSEGHPYFGAEGFSGEPSSLDVHGGITYGAFCQENGGKICHVPLPGEPDRVWWLGFDCGHAWDIRPKDAVTYGGYHFRDHGAHYRDVDYVKREVTRLAEQIDRAGRGDQ
jgi:hypothetical protein